MDRKVLAQKLKDLLGNKKTLVISGGALVCVVILAGGAGYFLRSHSQSVKSATAEKTEKREKIDAPEGDVARADQAEEKSEDGHVAAAETSKAPSFFSKVLNKYAHVLVSLQDKVDEIRRVDEENTQLRLENQHLRLAIESQHFENYAEKAQKLTQAYEMKLSKEAGNKVGRTLAGIAYKIPTDLIPSQLYQLGLTYFKSREDERAAVILSFLTGLEDDNSFKTAQNYLITGIAWYRLENYELANFYFDHAGGRYVGQAKVWKAIVAERQGQHVVAQQRLREVMDRNPHSLEAHWINPLAEQSPEELTESKKEAEREPAGQR